MAEKEKAKERWKEFDAEMRKYEKEKQERKKRKQQNAKPDSTKKKQNGSSVDKTFKLKVSGVLRNYRPTASDTLSRVVKLKLMKKAQDQGLTEEEEQSFLKDAQSRMHLRRKEMMMRRAGLGNKKKNK